MTGKKRRKNGAAAAAAGSGLLLPSPTPMRSGTEDGTAGPNSDVKRGGTERNGKGRVSSEPGMNGILTNVEERESARERENGVKKSVKWCRFFVQ